MRFRQAPLCRYRFKVIFDDIIFLLSGNIIEYICFWRFNSIIMTWNKSLIFTKSVIMGLNNISPWPCPLCIVRLPCVITWLYSTPLLIMRAVGAMACLSLRKANFPGSRRTQYSVVSDIFYCYHCFVLFALFFHTMANISIFLSHWLSHINFYFPFSQFMCRCKDWNACKNWWYFCTVLLREITQIKTDRNIANFCYIWKKYQGKVSFSFLPFDNCISGILYLKFEEKIYLGKNIIAKKVFLPLWHYGKIPCSVISESWKISKIFIGYNIKSYNETP